MKNPLHRRLPRELRQDIGKFTALFLFLVLTIGFVSGFLVADGSTKTAYDESFEKYSVEDGHFTLALSADDTLVSKLEDKDVSVYELFYKDKTLENENTIRIFKNRTEVNKVCLLKGSMPSADNEIAIDRLYAENNEISIGNTIKIDGSNFKVSGFAALSDYNALFKNNTDMMFDANRFCVAIVTDNAFDELSESGLKYCYAWRNNNQSLSDTAKNKIADELTDILVSETVVTDFVKQADNQAIMFTGEDMGSDKSMMTWMLYIVMVILAFVFAITTKSTIERESSVIGTLRASGYTQAELLRHYLTLPLLVTIVAAIVGNIWGYTSMKEMVVQLYYHSYSLPTYVTIWNAEAFILTTVVPCLIILAVNLLVLSSLLSLSPLQFLRYELKKKKKKRVAKLPEFNFLTRFRIRIIFQNLSAYITMFVGILLASLMLMFGMMMSPLLSNFKTEVIDSQFADYQYILKAPVETENESAEKYCVTSLNTDNGEEITVYGISDNSKHIDDITLPEGENEIVVSNCYMEKYGLQIGDKITLNTKYDNKSYTFKITDSYYYAATLAVFISSDSFNSTFEYDSDYFSGYLSDEKLTDIDDNMIASVITQSDLTVIADQLDDSMGMMMPMFCGFAIILYMLLIYLLAKMIVEKNAQYISMIKILGYSSREAGKLYNTSTAIVVLLSLVISLPICYYAVKGIYYIMMQEINGWLTFYIAPWVYVTMLAIGIVCYFIVHLIQMKKIGKIPMSQSLKNVE